MLGMLLVLCAVLFLWISFGRDSAEAAAPEPTEPAVMLRASAAMLPGGGETQAEATPEPTVQPTPEPVLTPPGSSAFAVSARPDGNAVTPKDDLCYWGMELLDAGAQAHRCRFKSGSGGRSPPSMPSSRGTRLAGLCEDAFGGFADAPPSFRAARFKAEAVFVSARDFAVFRNDGNAEFFHFHSYFFLF